MTTQRSHKKIWVPTSFLTGIFKFWPSATKCQKMKVLKMGKVDNFAFYRVDLLFEISISGHFEHFHFLALCSARPKFKNAREKKCEDVGTQIFLCDLWVVIDSCCFNFLLLARIF